MEKKQREDERHPEEELDAGFGQHHEFRVTDASQGADEDGEGAFGDLAQQELAVVLVVFAVRQAKQLAQGQK